MLAWRSISRQRRPPRRQTSSLLLDAGRQLADKSRGDRMLSTDAAAGATRSVAESCKLATTRVKTGKGHAGMGARKGRAEAGGSLRHRQSAQTKLAELKHRLREIGDLNAAGALLGWDHATYMPQCGAGARARQSAT